MQYCACVCEKLSKNTGNGALCRMSFGSQPQRKELSDGGGDGTTAAVASATAAAVAVGSVAFAYLLPLAPTCFRRPASLYVGRLLYVVELLGSRRRQWRAAGRLLARSPFARRQRQKRRPPPPMYVRRPCVHNECGSIFLYILLQRQQSCRRNVRHAQRCA